MKNKMRSCLAALIAGTLITGCTFVMNPGERFYDNEKGIAEETALEFEFTADKGDVHTPG